MYFLKLRKSTLSRFDAKRFYIDEIENIPGN